MAVAWRSLPAGCAASLLHRQFLCRAESVEESSFAAMRLRSVGGAEFNITVALSRLGWGGHARWVSVLPQCVLGDDFLRVLGKA